MQETRHCVAGLRNGSLQFLSITVCATPATFRHCHIAALTNFPIAKIGIVQRKKAALAGLF